MVRLSVWALSAALLSAVSAAPAQPQRGGEKRQYDSPVNRSQAVVDTFKLSWEAYYQYAFPNDELYPITNSFGNSRYKQPHITHCSAELTDSS